jgi:hypothetical protein
MGRFFEALKAGVKGFNSANDPTEYSVAGGRCAVPLTSAVTSRGTPRSR